MTVTGGGGSEMANIDLVKLICKVLYELRPAGKPHEKLIEFVNDRPGHDRRYAVDFDKIRIALGWQPEESFESGLRKTVEWYVANQDWLRSRA